MEEVRREVESLDDVGAWACDRSDVLLSQVNAGGRGTQRSHVVLQRPLERRSVEVQTDRAVLSVLRDPARRDRGAPAEVLAEHVGSAAATAAILLDGELDFERGLLNRPLIQSMFVRTAPRQCVFLRHAIPERVQS